MKLCAPWFGRGGRSSGYEEGAGLWVVSAYLCNFLL